MPKVNKHTQELFKYIFYAPEEIQKKYNSGISKYIYHKKTALKLINNDVFYRYKIIESGTYKNFRDKSGSYLTVYDWENYERI